MACFGIKGSRRALFEKDAKRANSGGDGRIDVFQAGLFLGETKSLGVDLDTADQQILDYLRGGSISPFEFPHYLVSHNFARVRVEWLGDEGWKIEFGLEDIVGHLDQILFFAGEETITKKEENASIAAAKLMARLYNAMVGEDSDTPVSDDAPIYPEDEEDAVHHASMFMTRILFLLYGDDAGLWEEDLFYRWVMETTTVENLGSQLSTLFQVLNMPPRKLSSRLPDLLAGFPYVNGELFVDTMPTDFYFGDARCID